MTLLTPRYVFRKYVTDGVPDSGEHSPAKAEIIQLLGSVFGTTRGGWVVTGTKAELLLVTPDNETDGGVVLYDPDPSNNGYYDRDALAWVRQRGFPDSFANIALAGAANAQTGTVFAGVDPATTGVFFAVVTTENTGAMTLSIDGEAARDVVNAAGDALSAGQWTGVVMFFINGDGDYQLINDAGAAAAAAASATLAEYWAGFAGGAVLPDGYVTRPKLSAALTANIGINFDTVAGLLADTQLSYSTGDYVVAEGDIITAGGFRYSVAATGAAVIASGNLSGYHVITAGGVKLLVLSASGVGFNVKAFGAKGDNSTADQPAVQKAIFAVGGGGGRVFFPQGNYRIGSRLVSPPNCAGLILSGESIRGTALVWDTSGGGASRNIIELSPDLDNAIIENFTLENLGDAQYGIFIGCVRVTMQRIFANPSVKFSVHIIATSTSVTTYNITMDDCHIFSSAVSQVHAVAVNIARGHCFNAKNCMFSGHVIAVQLGNSTTLAGASIVGCRFEMFGGVAVGYPGATNAKGISCGEVWGLSVTGCTFELASDEDPTSIDHRGISISDVRGALISGNSFQCQGQAEAIIHLNNSAAAGIIIEGNSIFRLNGSTKVSVSGTGSLSSATIGVNPSFS